MIFGISSVLQTLAQSVVTVPPLPVDSVGHDQVDPPQTNFKNISQAALLKCVDPQLQGLFRLQSLDWKKLVWQPIVQKLVNQIQDGTIKIRIPLRAGNYKINLKSEFVKISLNVKSGYAWLQLNIKNGKLNKMDLDFNNLVQAHIDQLAVPLVGPLVPYIEQYIPIEKISLDAFWDRGDFYGKVYLKTVIPFELTDRVLQALQLLGEVLPLDISKLTAAYLQRSTQPQKIENDIPYDLSFIDLANIGIASLEIKMRPGELDLGIAKLQIDANHNIFKLRHSTMAHVEIGPWAFAKVEIPDLAIQLSQIAGSPLVLDQDAKYLKIRSLAYRKQPAFSIAGIQPHVDLSCNANAEKLTVGSYGFIYDKSNQDWAARVVNGNLQQLNYNDVQNNLGQGTVRFDKLTYEHKADSERLKLFEPKIVFKNAKFSWQEHQFNFLNHAHRHQFSSEGMTWLQKKGGSEINLQNTSIQLHDYVYQSMDRKVEFADTLVDQIQLNVQQQPGHLALVKVNGVIQNIDVIKGVVPQGIPHLSANLDQSKVANFKFNFDGNNLELQGVDGKVEASLHDIVVTLGKTGIAFPLMTDLVLKSAHIMGRMDFFLLEHLTDGQPIVAKMQGDLDLVANAKGNIESMESVNKFKFLVDNFKISAKILALALTDGKFRSTTMGPARFETKELTGELIGLGGPQVKIDQAYVFEAGWQSLQIDFSQLPRFLEDKIKETNSNFIPIGEMLGMFVKMGLKASEIKLHLNPSKHQNKTTGKGDIHLMASNLDLFALQENSRLLFQWNSVMGKIYMDFVGGKPIRFQVRTRETEVR